MKSPQVSPNNPLFSNSNKSKCYKNRNFVFTYYIWFSKLMLWGGCAVLQQLHSTLSYHITPHLWVHHRVDDREFVLQFSCLCFRKVCNNVWSQWENPRQSERHNEWNSKNHKSNFLSVHMCTLPSSSQVGTWHTVLSRNMFQIFLFIRFTVYGYS